MVRAQLRAVVEVGVNPREEPAILIIGDPPPRAYREGDAQEMVEDEVEVDEGEVGN